MCVCVCVYVCVCGGGGVGHEILYCIAHEYNNIGLSVIMYGAYYRNVLYPEAQTSVDNSALHAHEPQTLRFYTHYRQLCMQAKYAVYKQFPILCSS